MEGEFLNQNNHVDFYNPRSAVEFITFCTEFQREKKAHFRWQVEERHCNVFRFGEYFSVQIKSSSSYYSVRIFFY